MLLLFVEIQPFEIEPHLPAGGSVKCPLFKLNRHQSVKIAVKHQQIQMIVLSVDDHSLLALNKSKAVCFSAHRC
jgi:hypothetical protein